MPNRFVEKNGRTVEMLTRVPVNRGSLLKSIDNLLKTIETSENAVMIPTLLKDKVRVDACELLFVAKILKASILGHSDLVEFYMNHIGQTSSALQQQQPPTEPPSPSIRLQSPMGSPLLTHAISNHQREQQQQQQQALSTANSNSQGASSVSSMSTCSTASSSMSLSQAAAAANTPARSSNGSASCITAHPADTSATNSLCSAQSSIRSETTTATSSEQLARPPGTPTPTNLNPTTNLPEHPEAHEALLATANKPLLARQAQPPSLLQLTTTNNHINSMSDMLQGAQQLSPSLEQLTGQLAALQQQQSSALSNSTSATSASNGTSFEGLSISTTAANATLQLDQLAATGTPPTTRHELRSSRSAGCLFRANSGATSPRTPNQTTPSTPFPQAETLDGAAGAANGLVGEPGSLVKLLLQVEQLKSSIAHCTTLLESVVELYKKSIDNLA